MLDAAEAGAEAAGGAGGGVGIFEVRGEAFISACLPDGCRALRRLARIRASACETRSAMAGAAPDCGLVVATGWAGGIGLAAAAAGVGSGIGGGGAAGAGSVGFGAAVRLPENWLMAARAISDGLAVPGRGVRGKAALARGVSPALSEAATDGGGVLSPPLPLDAPK